MGGRRILFFPACVFLMSISAGAWSGAASPREKQRPSWSKTTVVGTEASKGSRPERILAVQVSLFYSQNLKEVEERIRELAEAGANTLIVRVFQNEGDRPYGFATPRHTSGVYFQTRYAPVVDDVLGPLSRIAHRQGLRVFAWMTTRNADYGLENRKSLRAIRYDLEKKTMVPARGLNIFRADVVARLETLFSDLAKYPIEGILFQDDLVLRHTEGFSPEAKALFLREVGSPSDPSLFYGETAREDSGRIIVSRYTDAFWRWTQWKNRKLLDLAKRLMEAGRRTKPNLEFAINFYYESVLEPDKGMAWYSQSLKAARSLPFDYFAVMAYQRQMQEELGLTREETLGLVSRLADRATETVGDPTKVLMKIQAVGWRDSRPVPQRELEEILRALGGKPGIHMAIVPYQPDLPTRSLIRSFLSPRVQAKERRDSSRPMAMYEPPPTSFPR